MSVAAAKVTRLRSVPEGEPSGQSASGCRRSGRATAQGRQMPMSRASATPIHRHSTMATQIRRVREWRGRRLGFGLDGRLQFALRRGRLRRLGFGLDGRLAFLLRSRSRRILGDDRGRTTVRLASSRAVCSRTTPLKRLACGEEAASLESPLSNATIRSVPHRLLERTRVDRPVTMGPATAGDQIPAVPSGRNRRPGRGPSRPTDR